jgi:REP-associated tyrosine transposase
MPRRTRIRLDGVPLHIVQRGHNREPCFFAEDDYLSYLHWLGEALGQGECALHAYVLMSNHVHLLLTPRKAEAVPRLMISLGRRYVQYVNRSYRRTGPLWDSRYKSSLVQAKTYLLACQRYIELNPVRAAMLEDPARYRWTSYRANALGQPDARLTRHALYRALGQDDKARQGAYRALFRAQLDLVSIDGIRLALNQSQPPGNERFYARIEKMTSVRREAKPHGRPRVDRRTTLAGPSRACGVRKVEPGPFLASFSITAESEHAVEPLLPGSQYREAGASWIRELGPKTTNAHTPPEGNRATGCERMNDSALYRRHDTTVRQERVVAHLR